MSLTSRGYQPLPNRYELVRDRGKELVLHIPAAKDKAMLMLYSYALDPVAESTADKRSFFARKGRSAHDAHAYIMRDLELPDAPEWIVRADVKAFFDHIVHGWLIDNIPMDKVVLKKFLRAGVVKKWRTVCHQSGYFFCVQPIAHPR